MSDIPTGPLPGAEDLDLGEVDDEADRQDEADGDAEGNEADGDAEADSGDSHDEDGAEGQARAVEGRGRRPGRSERLREQLREREREVAELRGFRQAAEQFRPQQQPQIDYAGQQRAQQERMERLSMMSPVEAAEFIANEKAQQFQQAMLMQHLQTEDRLDKRDFDQQARVSRVHAQYRAEVERVLSAERQAGNLRATREEILDRIIGRQVRERSNNAAPRQRSAAAARVRSQRTQPTNGRGDGAAGAGRGKWGDPEFDERMAREGLRKGIF